MEKINAKVVYVCGNHEFWDNDYEEVIKSLQSNIINNPKSNVSFLHNDFVIIDDKLFLGSTLWSDLGKDLNPDLFNASLHTMNDNYYITYKSWYENSENIKKINNVYGLRAEDCLEKKQWNAFAEREENEKTLSFYYHFNQIHEVLSKIPEAIQKLEQARNSRYDFMKIDEETYQHKMAALMSYKTQTNYQQWLDENRKTLNLELMTIDFKLDENQYNEETNAIQSQIFNRLKNIDLSKLKIINVSHHLPFLEERLIGRQEWFDDKINKEYTNPIADTLYSLRKGLNYSFANYFWRIAKGEMSKEENITAIVHYSNDGSNNIEKSFLNKVYCWVHGHEHHYNYEDVLKGIKIVTNPLAHSMAVFKFSDGKIKLNEHYKKYHKIKDEEGEIQHLKDSFLRKFNTELSKENLENAVDLWALKNFSWDDYIQLYDYTEKLNKKLLKTLSKNPDWEYEMKEVDVMNMSLLMDSIDLSIMKLEEMDKKINEGVTIRKSLNYSFNEKYGHALEMDHIEHYYKVFTEPLKKYNRNITYQPQWSFQSWLKTAFYNAEYMEVNKKKLQNSQKILNKFNFKRLNEIIPKWLDLFDKAFQVESINKFEMDRVLSSKYSKLVTEIKDNMSVQYKEAERKKFDF